MMIYHILLIEVTAIIVGLICFAIYDYRSK